MAGPSKLRLLAVLTALGVGVGLTTVTSASPVAAAVPYAVVPPTVKIRPTQTVTGAASARLSGGRNEFLSFQLVLPGGSTGQRDVTVALDSALSGSGGTIPAANVTIYREDYYDAKQASTAFGDTGRWPDALIPAVDTLYGERRRAFPVTVPARENRVAFVDILVPPGQAPGRYEGALRVTAAGTSSTVPVSVDVRNFTLPATSSARSLFKLNWRTPCDALHPGCDFAQRETAWQSNADLARLALDHRITIANPQYQPPTNATERAAFVQHMLPLIRGTARTRLPGARMTTVSIDTRDAGQVAAWRSLAATHGFSGLAVAYATACDEPGDEPDRWLACQKVADMVRGAWPGLPNVVTTDLHHATTPQTGLDRLALIDVIVPVIDHLDGVKAPYDGNQRGTYDAFLSRPGKQIWVYTSCDASGCAGAGETDPRLRGWVDYTIDTAASQNRAMGWVQYLDRTSGELYYAVDHKLTSAWTDQWAFGGNGDGTLFYPGTPDRIGGTRPVPLPSLRLKMIRNGNQDLEYLELADRAGRGAEARRIARALFPTAHDTVVSAEAVERARAQLADLIAPPSASPWSPLPGAGRDVSVGADGSAWLIGASPVGSGGNGIYRWSGSGWTRMPGAASHIAVDASGRAWAVNSAGAIYSWAGTGWLRRPGKARDIAVGGDGTVWVVGASVVPGGHSIHRWTGSGWATVAGGASRVAGAPDGRAWAVDDRGAVLQQTATGWRRMPGTGRDISVGPDGTVWLIGNTAGGGGYSVHRWAGSAWTRLPGSGVVVAGAPGRHAWLVNRAGRLYRTLPSTVPAQLRAYASPGSDDSGEQLQATPAVLADLGLSSRHDFTRPGARPQVLLHAGDRQALFTLAGVLPVAPDAAQAQVGLTAAGFARLGIDPAAAPELVGRLSTRLSDVSRALFAEEPVRGPPDARVAVLAPHGGSIEPGSDTVAAGLAGGLGREGVRTWSVAGRRLLDVPGDTARWHIASEDLSERSFPGLSSLLTTRFPLAVTVHGKGAGSPDVEIGGRAPEALRSRIATQLTRAGVSAAAVSSGPRAGQHPDNIVNRLSPRGIQLELSPRVRSETQLRQRVIDALVLELSRELAREP